MLFFAMPLSTVASDGFTQGPAPSIAAPADSVSELEQQTRNFLGPNAESENQATARAIIQRGLAQSAKGDSQSAEASFRTALYVDPSSADARYNLGVIAENKGDLSSALEFYQGALTTHPNDPELKDAVQAVQSRLKLSGGLAQNGTGTHGLSGKSPFATPESPFPSQLSGANKMPMNQGPFTAPESMSSQPLDWMKSPPPAPSYPPVGQNLGSPPTYYPQSNMSRHQQSRTTRRAVRRLVRMGLNFGRL
jgi:tetratricopeptide (TPR) repeat protein